MRTSILVTQSKLVLCPSFIIEDICLLLLKHTDGCIFAGKKNKRTVPQCHNHHSLIEATDVNLKTGAQNLYLVMRKKPPGNEFKNYIGSEDACASESEEYFLVKEGLCYLLQNTE
jgi:hypothetical protein